MRKTLSINSPRGKSEKNDKQKNTPSKVEKTHNGHVSKISEKSLPSAMKTDKIVSNGVKYDKPPMNGISNKDPKVSPVKLQPQRQVSLSPPDYYIDPKILLTSFVEEEISFAGRIDNFPLDQDITNRTTILNTIDRVKKRGTIAWKGNEENRAIISINVYHIKIVRWKNQELLLRLGMHQIASLSYIKDDRQHILVIKYGHPQNGTCQLAVVYCNSKDDADKICALVSQCFKLVYTEATMQFIDDQFKSCLPETPSPDVSIYDSMPVMGKRPTKGIPQKYAIFTGSLYGSADSSSIYRSLPRRGEAPSEHSSWSAAELLQDYVYKLQTKMSASELNTFAKLLTTPHADLTIEQFCDKVMELFGEERKQLMTGMWPFIGDRDHAYFERYLEAKGISAQGDTGYWSMTSASSTGPDNDRAPVLARYMDSLHFEDTSPTKRSLTSHSDPGPHGHPSTYIRFLDNIHYNDPYVTIP